MDFSGDDTKMVKGFAIILMLYHHLFAFPNRIQDGSSYIPLLTFTSVDSAMLIGLFGKMCVALFLFLGGYGTWMSFQAKRDKQLLSQPKDATASADLLSSFTLAKVKGLYTPYLKVFVIVVPIALILGDARVTATFESLFWNITGLNITYNGEWWFFTDYFILLATFPLMVRFFARRHATVSVDLLAICVWNATVTWIIPPLAQANWASGITQSIIWTKLFETMQRSACFLTGCLFARWNLLTKAKKRFSGHYLACASFLLCLAFLVCLRFKLNVGYRYDFLYAPFVSIALSVLATTKTGALLSKPLRAIGKHSTNIWLTHSFFCYHWCQAFIYLPKWSPLVFLLLLGVSYAFSLIIDFIWVWLSKALEAANKKSSYLPR